MRSRRLTATTTYSLYNVVALSFTKHQQLVCSVSRPHLSLYHNDNGWVYDLSRRVLLPFGQKCAMKLLPQINTTYQAPGPLKKSLSQVDRYQSKQNGKQEEKKQKEKRTSYHESTAREPGTSSSPGSMCIPPSFAIYRPAPSDRAAGLVGRTTRV